MEHKFLYWSPRVFSIAFAMFLSLFALEVFSIPQTIFPNLFFALLPAGIALLVAAIAWKWDLAGALLFFGLALSYVWMVGLYRPWSWYAAISGPAVLIGILFLLNWQMKKSKKIILKNNEQQDN
jgi:hypothetical protein